MLGIEKSNNEIIESTLASRKKFVRALFERPDSFAKILPYEEYLSEAGMFVLKDGSLGAVFELGLIEHEPLEAKRTFTPLKEVISFLATSIARKWHQILVLA